MSDKPADDEEDWGPKIETSAEMAEALREATEALEARQKGAAGVPHDSKSGPAHSSGNSSDKMTIEILSGELQELKGLHEEKLKELEDQNDRYLRLQAEFENFRRRSLKDKQESFKFGHQNLVKDLLSAVDNLDRALEHGAQNAGDEVKGILDGVELVRREILGAFAKHGIQQIEAEGQIFDPAVHEAMGQVPMAGVPNNTVIQVLEKGYRIHDRMLRPARVIVSRAIEGEAGESGQRGAEDDSA